jgi:hypothetical protein
MVIFPALVSRKMMSEWARRYNQTSASYRWRVQTL